MCNGMLYDESNVQYDCSYGLLSIEEVDTIIRSNLKVGKAPGIDHLTAEHFISAYPTVVSHLTNLFNAITLHGYVPNSFGLSVIVPLVKDRCGDISKLTNYKAISIQY